MVLAGPLDLVTAFADRSHNLYRRAGIVTGRAGESPDVLFAAAGTLWSRTCCLVRRRPCGRCSTHSQHALTARPERDARGLDAGRVAVRRGRPELLVAEETTARAEAGVVAGLIDTVIDRVSGKALRNHGPAQFALRLTQQPCLALTRSPSRRQTAASPRIHVEIMGAHHGRMGCSRRLTARCGQ